MTVLARMLFRHRPTQYGLLMLALVAILVTIGQRMELARNDWAAWVQAIGSVAAIWGAFSIASSQLARERQLETERRHESERQRFRIVGVMFGKIETYVDAVDGLTVFPFLGLASTYPVDILEECIDDLRKMAPFEMPHEQLVMISYAVHRALITLSAQLVQVQSSAIDQTGPSEQQQLAIAREIEEVKEFIKVGLLLCESEVAVRTISH